MESISEDLIVPSTDRFMRVRVNISSPDAVATTVKIETSNNVHFHEFEPEPVKYTRHWSEYRRWWEFWK